MYLRNLNVSYDRLSAVTAFVLHSLHSGRILPNSSISFTAIRIIRRQTWVRFNFLFDSAQSQSFDSPKLMTHNGLTRIDSNQLTTQNDFWNLIQIDSLLKKLPEYFDSIQFTTKTTFQNSDSNRLMTRKAIWNIDSNLVMTHWFESTVDFVDVFGDFT